MEDIFTLPWLFLTEWQRSYSNDALLELAGNLPSGNFWNQFSFLYLKTVHRKMLHRNVLLWNRAGHSVGSYWMLRAAGCLVVQEVGSGEFYMQCRSLILEKVMGEAEKIAKRKFLVTCANSHQASNSDPGKQSSFPRSHSPSASLKLSRTKLCWLLDFSSLRPAKLYTKL